MGKSPWIKTILKDPNSLEKEAYSAFIQGKGIISCVIAIRKDGFVAINAVDPDWHGRIVTQFAFFRSKSGYVQGCLINMKTIKTISNAKKAAKPPRGSEWGYSIFDKKFAAMAKKLPVGVREMFNGAFGVR